MSRPGVFVALVALSVLPAFFQGCGCGDENVTVTVITPPGGDGGTTPDSSAVDDDPLGPIIYNGLDPKTCINDVSAPQVDPALIYVKPPIAGDAGSRALAVLVWSFCNPGRNDLPAQANYKLLVSPHNLVVGQVNADPDCRTRPAGVAGFPSKCFPPIPGNDKSVSIALPALTHCACHSEIVFINVPPEQEATLTKFPPTQRVTIPSGDYHFTLSSPWDVTILDQEVILQ
jgi:hypothetical protein